MRLVQLAVLLNFVVLAASQGCCLPFKFNVSITDLNTINSDLITVDFLEMDFEAGLQRLAFSSVYPPTGKIEYHATQVLDFKAGKSYTVSQANPSFCEEKYVSLKPQRCVPADAIYMGGTYLGPQLRGLLYEGWRYKLPGSDLTVTTAFTRDGCVPLVQGLASQSSVAGLQFFSGFGEGLAGPISIPDVCRNK